MQFYINVPQLAPSDLIWVTLGQGSYCSASLKELEAADRQEQGIEPPMNIIVEEGSAGIGVVSYTPFVSFSCIHVRPSVAQHDYGLR